ncbi:hypothetical protein DFH08DRAFT_823400 [Mycena albidolilacea]|uniref:Uncharacterized protein n=1 Tax=Mycena albidolilacea TaxID=1033008 RepID=A0AAD6Z661_9AGAR|nr:hypothetical protein DFH08DRAFT_823400 [Mycena albidolilacea]
MPLAVDLMAHLSDYEGLSNVLAQWDTERTALLSVGYDRKSNVDASIQLSLPVLESLPIVTDACQQFLPPSTALVQCLRKLFYVLLELYMNYNAEQLWPVMKQITQNLANFQEVLQQGLYENTSDLGDTIYSISKLSSFYRITGHSPLPLIECIQHIIHFMTQVLHSSNYYLTFDGEQIIIQTISILELVINSLLESKFYNAHRNGEYCTAQAHAREAQKLSQLSANLYHEATALWIEAMISHRTEKHLRFRRLKLSEGSSQGCAAVISCMRYFPAGTAALKTHTWDSGGRSSTMERASAATNATLSF